MAKMPQQQLEMESALKYSMYDVKTVWGHGAHNGNHGGAVLPDTLRWLWNSDKNIRA